ncbi:MAG: hypothetical protein VX822_06020 [Candidatus Neomarinimicrobiota bacterium]|nr:hypothetical protein [Candidatus Neomarinimicrobiota bacterium]
MTLETCWALSKIWYPDRLDPDWNPKTVEMIKSLFDEVGLEGEFWNVGI